MKSNEDYLKELFCAIYTQTSQKNSSDIANKDAIEAIKNFNKQFGNTEIILPYDASFIKIYSETYEKQTLHDLVHVMNYRFKGCTIDMSKEIIPSTKVKLPYWLKVNDNATIEIELKNPR